MQCNRFKIDSVESLAICLGNFRGVTIDVTNVFATLDNSPTNGIYSTRNGYTLEIRTSFKTIAINGLSAFRKDYVSQLIAITESRTSYCFNTIWYVNGSFGTDKGISSYAGYIIWDLCVLTSQNKHIIVRVDNCIAIVS